MSKTPVNLKASTLSYTDSQYRDLVYDIMKIDPTSPLDDELGTSPDSTNMRGGAFSGDALDILFAGVNEIMDGRLQHFMNAEPSEFPMVNTLNAVAVYHIKRSIIDLQSNVEGWEDIVDLIKNFNISDITSAVGGTLRKLQAVNEYIKTSDNPTINAIMNYRNYMASINEKIEEASSSYGGMAMSFFRSGLRIGTKVTRLDKLVELIGVANIANLKEKSFAQYMQIIMILSPIFTARITPEQYSEATRAAGSVFTYDTYRNVFMDASEYSVQALFDRDQYDMIKSAEKQHVPSHHFESILTSEEYASVLRSDWEKIDRDEKSGVFERSTYSFFPKRPTEVYTYMTGKRGIEVDAQRNDSSVDMRINDSLSLAQVKSHKFTGGKLKFIVYLLTKGVLNLVHTIAETLLLVKLFGVVWSNRESWDDFNDFSSAKTWIRHFILAEGLMDSALDELPGPVAKIYGTADPRDSKRYADGTHFIPSYHSPDRENIIDRCSNVIALIIGASASGMASGAYGVISDLIEKSAKSGDSSEKTIRRIGGMFGSYTKGTNTRNSISISIGSVFSFMRLIMVAITFFKASKRVLGMSARGLDTFVYFTAIKKRLEPTQRKDAIRAPRVAQVEERIEAVQMLVRDEEEVLGEVVRSHHERNYGVQSVHDMVIGFVIKNNKVTEVIRSLRQAVLKLIIGKLIDGILNFDQTKTLPAFKKAIFSASKVVCGMIKHTSLVRSNREKAKSFYDLNNTISKQIIKLESGIFKAQAESANKVFIRRAVAFITSDFIAPEIGSRDGSMRNIAINGTYTLSGLCPAYMRMITGITGGTLIGGITLGLASLALSPMAAAVCGISSACLTLAGGGWWAKRALDRATRGKEHQDGGNQNMDLAIVVPTSQLATSINELKQLLVGSTVRVNDNKTNILFGDGTELDVLREQVTIQFTDETFENSKLLMMSVGITEVLATKIVEKVRLSGTIDNDLYKNIGTWVNEVSKSSTQDPVEITEVPMTMSGGNKVFNFVVDFHSGKKYPVNSTEGKNI